MGLSHSKTHSLLLPDDFHLHLRRGRLLQAVLPYTAQYFRRVMVMPNTDPPILTADDAVAYRHEIMVALPTGVTSFEPLMTIKLTMRTTPAMIRAARAVGVVAAKLYPVGMTTNSDDGVDVSQIVSLYPVFRAMSDVGMVLSIHGEMPGVTTFKREQAFLPVLAQLAGDFSRLKIVLEHVTTWEAIEAVQSLPRIVAATITLHHLLLTIDDVLGGKLMPHQFCKPVAKSIEDRIALRIAAMSGSPKFFFGSDSAPHLIAAKERAEGAAGIFTAPVLLPGLIEVFESCGCLDAFHCFVERFGSEFYGLTEPKSSRRYIDFRREPWVVPMDCNGVLPFLAGQTLQWQPT